MRLPSAVLACTTLALAACADSATTAPDRSLPAGAPLAAAAPNVFPDVIALPNGFAPEGIAFGRGTTFFVGSLATGAIYRGDARTGTGALLVLAQPGRIATGLEYDQRTDRLFVAGNVTGQGYVYDASTGATLGVYQLTAPNTGFINDVVVTKDAAYFTDSRQPVLYRLPLGKNGALPAAGAVQTLPLTGDYVFVPGALNANGIVATPNEKQLIIVNSTTGTLYLVDAATGVATRIDLGGASVPNGDGLLLHGHTLYVVQNQRNQIAVIDLSPDLTSGTIERLITDPDFAVPTTIDVFGSSLYAVNARFGVTPGPNVPYQVVRVPR